MLVTAPDRVVVHGNVSSGFESVREAFADNFPRRRELGGACCVYYRGEKVVDLWGGIRNKGTGELWDQDTMVVTLGFYEGELLRRLDPLHRSLGHFFHDEIAAPLEECVYIRVPEWIPNSRLATLSPPTPLRLLTGFPLRLTLETMNRHSNIYRALVTNPGSAVYQDKERVYARNLEVPSGGGVATARGIAHAYGVFATGGRELGLRQETLDLLAAPAIPPTRGFFDECMKEDGIQFSLGFMKSTATWPFGGARSFGSPGAGGSLGFADPEAGIGYGYVTSQMGTALTGDPRDMALRNALYSATKQREMGELRERGGATRGPAGQGPPSEVVNRWTDEMNV